MTNNLDPSLFSDVADAVGINDPAFVEKDYYVVQLLKLLKTLELENFKLVFCGGTCLSKAYQNIQRMSEDVDIKMVPKNKNVKREQRKALCKSVKSMISSSHEFELNNGPTIQDGYKTQMYEVQYPKYFISSILKPSLKLELVQSEVYQPIQVLPIKSMYAEAREQPAEIKALDCVNVESILVEKLIALLWRIAAEQEDSTLIRHMYDIHQVYRALIEKLDFQLLNRIAKQSLKEHAERYHNKHPDFKTNSQEVLSQGLEKLQSNDVYQQQYKDLSPLIYGDLLPKWDEAHESLEALYQQLAWES